MEVHYTVFLYNCIKCSTHAYILHVLECKYAEITHAWTRITDCYQLLAAIYMCVYMYMYIVPYMNKQVVEDT